MNHQIIRNSFETLLNELFEGPSPHGATWIVSNEPNSGILGTLHQISLEQAKHVPEGLSHSIAEHVAHLHFALNHALAQARGEIPQGDWKSSWDATAFDECAWQRLQRSLREAELRLRMDIHDRHDFDHFELTCGFMSSIAHAAYHLGCIRQIVAMVRAQRTASQDDSHKTLAAAE